MQKKVRNFMEEYHMVEREDTVLAAVSGGADSLCLLMLLHKFREELGFALCAVHVEHGIRGEASLCDARFVEEICGKYRIPCKIYHCQALEYAKEMKLSVEEAARKLRYQMFREAAEELGANKIAVAHNQNDCAETMLFHLARGSGLKGLCGILPMRGQVIRPLLCVEREEIESYLAREGQVFCTDETNGQLIYTRNKIRHQVLPLLAQVNANAVSHMNQAAGIVAEAAELIEGLRQQAAEKYVCVSVEGICVSQGLLGEPPLIVREVLHNVLSEAAGCSKDISKVHVQQLQDLFARQSGKAAELPYGIWAQRTYEGILLRKGGDRGLIGKRGAGVPQPMCMELPIDGSLVISSYGYEICTKILKKNPQNEEIPKKIYTKWLDYDKIKGDLCLRNPKEGDFFILDAAGNRKKLSRYFIDKKIPASERAKEIVLAEENHVIWAVPGRISYAYKVTKETRLVLVVVLAWG